MKKLTLPLTALSLLMSNYVLYSQVPVRAAHVIIVLEENYAYSEIIGSSLAPTLTALSQTSYTANFTQDYAITHPSEPNYLCLFSGSQQGVTGDISGPAPGAPFNNCNLGSSLIQNGYTFIGYAESQPSLGWITTDDDPYYTKHCPWINWIGYNTNPDTIPITSDVPFSYTNGYTSGPVFPDSNNYSSLPTVSWVTPNIVDDMHNPAGDPTVAIPNGDAWFNTNIMPLVRWASNPLNNTVVITTWDEDDGTMGNNIALLVSSGLVNGGNYATTLNHYCVLKTIEDMYGLPECDSSASTSGSIDFPVAIWRATGINAVSGTISKVNVWPVPAKDELNIKVTSLFACDKASIGIYDITGRMVKEISTELKAGENTMTLSTGDVANGMYFLTVTGDKINISNKISIVR